MGGIRHAAILTPVLFLCLGSLSAEAQTVGGEPAGDPQTMRIDGRVEKTYKMQLEAAPKKQYCQAQISIEYTQRNTMAGVKGQIVNDECGPSGGTYNLSVRYKDEAGEIRNDEYEESWQRDHDEDIDIEASYPIGDNVDLIRVRARKIVCICAEPPDEGDGTDNMGENE